MTRISFTRSLVVAAAASAMVLATSLTATASSTATLNSADAALVPSSLKTTTWSVATDATYPPDESMSGNTMVGFDIDLIKAVATTLGAKVAENNVTFDNIIVGIDSGKYLIGNSSFTDTKAREKQVNFVDYYKAGEGVYVKSTSSFVFSGLQSFCGQTVAVESGTSEQTDAGNIKCSGGKKVTVTAYPNQNLANLAVSSGRVTAGFVDSQVAGYIVSASKGAFKLDGSPVNVAPYGIATPNTATGLALAQAIQAALKTLIANGTYKAIMANYGATSGDLTASQIVLNGATS